MFAKTQHRWYKSDMPARPLLRRHLTALLLFILLSLILTFPLISGLSSRVPGDGIDDPALAWNLWWIKFSLVDRQINPFDAGWMFYPIGINLAFYTLTILNGLLSVPLQVTAGLVPASNLILLSSFVLSGYGAYLLALHILTSRSTLHASRFTLHAAFLAGLLYAFASSKLFYAALGQFNIASSQWIPFAMLYILRSSRPGAHWREALLAALFLLLQAYAELTYATFLLIFAGLVLLWRLGPIVLGQAARSRPARLLRPLLVNFALLALITAMGLIPVLANMLPDMRAEGDFFVQGGGFADIFSADLAGYALPTQLHPLLGDLARKAANDSAIRPDGSQWQINKGQHLFLGYSAMALALLGLWQGLRRKWPDGGLWLLAVFLFFLLTLGPSLRIAGYDTGIPGPFLLVQALPFFKGNRYPSRYSVMLLASLVPLAAIGTAWLLGRLDRARKANLAAPFLAALLLFEHLSTPLPTANMAIPALYDIIADDPRPVAVLDLPLGWRNGFDVFGKQDLIIMAEQWWQTRHEKPILGGNTSRNPEYKFRYFLEAPLIGPLTILANADEAHPHIRDALAAPLAALQAGDRGLGGDAMLLAAADAAPEVLASLNIGYVVLHRNHVPAEFSRFVEEHLPLRLLAEEGQHRLYAVDLPAPPAQATLWPAADSLTLGEGWSGPAGPQEPFRWAQRRSARLIIPPLAPGPKQVIVRAKAAGPGQTLALRVAGHDSASQPLPETWSDLIFELPDGVLKEGVNEMLLRFGQTYPVTDLAQGEGVDRPGFSLLVESAGLEAGNYGHIWLNGVEVSPNQRGYNLALIDRASGQLRAAAHFDTHADPAASADLAQFLAQRREKDVLAVAVKDTAGDQLGAEAATALAALGLSDLRSRFRWSQAAIVAGEEVLAEERSAVQPAHVVWGTGWREEQAAAAVEWITIQPR